MSGGDLHRLTELLDEPFPIMTQAEAAKARVTVRVLTRKNGLERQVGSDLIAMLGLTPEQMTDSRWAESPSS